ncbi:MAG: DUF47 family protein [Bacteroidales bacterium]|nr:DUF47 family protein [Bacteroidales bacterium]MEE3407612.1 DUF47 family protein [Candidatus Cryptobacteroides sp.]SKC35831.1 Protein of unknown function DUF47 [Bacteroidales bacterium WCE2008]MBO7365567.1 DUF47 family protein [Bacteroidales bacterium]MBO7622995.1 DUF47 family protein [Bacteroidales bacterium]
MGIFNIFSTKAPEKITGTIDSLLENMDKALTVFKEGVKNYLYNDISSFTGNISTIAQIEAESAALTHEIESILYSRGYLIRYRGDIMRLLERFDHIISIISVDLIQFEIESPNIPSELKKEFMKLAELACLAAESSIPGAKAYFTDPANVHETTDRVYFYEKEAVKLSQAIKRTVFHDMDTLKLSEKFHLRYFALHIEDLARAAAKVAEQLSVMAIKRTL